MAATFADLGLSPTTLQALRDVGYSSPSPIQEQAIPALLQGRDVIGQAQTGTGKTAAFGLPILQYIDPSEDSVQALVLTPTRELCIQVTQALRTYGAHTGVDVVAVFGGAPIRNQQAQLRAGGHVVVGTVGRVLDLISRHSLMLHECRFVVLDEADEMLDLGFLEDVERILSLTPSSRQTALFSATMPPPIRQLADNYMYEPTTIEVEAATLTIDTVAQFQLHVDAKDKAAKLVEVLRAELESGGEATGKQVIVFVRTKIRCEQLYRTLRDRGMNVRALHGDMSQGSRDGVMLAFKAERVPILVATDVAARGLDISTVTHVINYDVPTSPDTYVHRIGRTGRVGRSGRAITFVEQRQQRELEAIERHIGTEIAHGGHRGRRDLRRRAGGRGRARRAGARPLLVSVRAGGRGRARDRRARRLRSLGRARPPSARRGTVAVIGSEKLSRLTAALERGACRCQTPPCRQPRVRSSSSCSRRTLPRRSRTSASSARRGSTTGSASTA